MPDTRYPKHEPSPGYMTEAIRHGFIAQQIEKGTMPQSAFRMADLVSLDAPNDPSKPIQFWQLYSVLGQRPIIKIAQRFYKRVYEDEDWFREPFERIGGVDHHVRTQASMWIDAMGGGHFYHGAEFRLNFHHYHNAASVMNDRGGARWASLMRATLDDSDDLFASDPRIRPAINTFLTHFFGKYAREFSFSEACDFGEVNPPVRLKLNFMNMSEAAIEALPEADLRDALTARGVDTSGMTDKIQLVGAALKL